MNSSHTGYIFPGQGSQKVGMLAELAESFSLVKETFLQASDVLGYDLWALTQTGPAEELDKTQITQPTILTASVAIWRLLKDQGGISPSLMAGHSLGEYSALTCAGVIDFADAVSLVQQRGEFMQSAVPLGVGGMSAIIGLDDDKVVVACEQAKQGEEVAAVNFNCPGQIVIAGHIDAVTRAGALCKEAGAKRALPLPVSAPFHCVLMKPAAEKFAAVLDEVTFNSPEIPVLQNFGLDCSSDPEVIRNNLVNQIFSPVPWIDTINKFAGSRINQVLEIGPGNVLSGFNRRIQPDMNVLSVNDLASLEQAKSLGESAA